MQTQAKDWWNVKDHGCIYENLSRHLVASGLSIELEALLCNVRWTLRRHKIGGWAALDLDFKRFLGDQGGSVGHGICKLYSLLKLSWNSFRRDQRLVGFLCVCISLATEASRAICFGVLKSVPEHFP